MDGVPAPRSSPAGIMRTLVSPVMGGIENSDRVSWSLNGNINNSEPSADHFLNFHKTMKNISHFHFNQFFKEQGSMQKAY
jgi:hypothetical protein